MKTQKMIANLKKVLFILLPLAGAAALPVAGANALGSVAAAPYTLIWTNAQPGTFVLTARAKDNLGVQTVSTPVTIRVTTPVTITSVGASNGVFNLNWTGGIGPYRLQTKTQLTDAAISAFVFDRGNVV